MSEPKRSIASRYEKRGNGVAAQRSIGHDGARDLGDHRLDEGHHVFLRDEAHLDVELRELRAAVGARVLVAHAVRDLEVAVEARDHQQLLELLRRLRQRVDVARLERATGTMKSRAPSGVDLIRIGVSTSTKPFAWCTSEIALSSFERMHHAVVDLLAAQVEVAVLQPQRSRRRRPAR